MYIAHTTSLNAKGRIQNSLKIRFLLQLVASFESIFLNWVLKNNPIGKKLMRTYFNSLVKINQIFKKICHNVFGDNVGKL